MKGLEFIAILILVFIFGMNYLPLGRKLKDIGKLQKSGIISRILKVFALILVIISYPFFIFNCLSIYNLVLNVDKYPSKLYNFESAINSIYQIDVDNKMIWVNSSLNSEVIILSIIYLIIVVIGYFFFSKSIGIQKIRFLLTRLSIRIKRINLKVLIVSVFILTILIKPIYTSAINPTSVETVECKHSRTYDSRIGKWSPCKNYRKEPAKLIDYFKIFGDAGIIEYRRIDLVVSFLFALSFSFAVLTWIPITTNKHSRNKNFTNMESQIRILKEMHEAGVLTEEEYKDELSKFKDRFV